MSELQQLYKTVDTVVRSSIRRIKHHRREELALTLAALLFWVGFSLSAWLPESVKEVLLEPWNGLPVVQLGCFVTGTLSLLYGAYKIWRLVTPPDLPAVMDRPAPIKGPMAFTPEDGPLFRKLGREDELQKLLGWIEDDQVPLIVMMGASGAGKTSLLRAGLTDILSGKDIAYHYWEAVPASPADRLFRAIRESWNYFPCRDGPKKDTEEFPEESPTALPESLNDLVNLPAELGPRRHVIVLDQFEQMRGESLSHSPVFRLLRKIVRESRPPHRVTWIIAFRREFRAEWSDFMIPEQERGFYSREMSLGLFSQDQAKQAAYCLVEEAALSVEQKVIENLIDTASVEGEVPPVDLGIGLQVLAEAASRQAGRTVTIRDYHFAGGAEGLLAEYISKQLKLFPQGDESVLLKALLALYNRTTNQRIAEGRICSEIAGEIAAPETRLRPELDRLAQRDMRLLEVVQREDGTEPRYRIPHERFVPALQRLAGQSLAEVDQARLRFEGAFAAWQNASQRRQYLLRGRELRLVERYQDQIPWGENPRLKRMFLDRSRRGRTRRRFGLVAVLVGCAIATWIGTKQVVRRSRLQEANDLVHQADSIRKSNRPGKRFEALASLKEAAAIGRELGQEPKWFDALRNRAIAALALSDVYISQSFDGFPPGTRRADLSPDFQLYARTTEQGACSIRRVADDVEIAALPELGEPANVRFGPGGLLVIHGDAGRSQLWSFSGRQPICRLNERHTESVCSFSADGRLLALGYQNGSIGVYATDTGKPQHHLAPERITYYAIPALHPTEPVVAVCSYRSEFLQIRDLKTGAVRVSRKLPWRQSGMCAWSPDGRTLAVSAGEGGREGDRSNLYAFDAASHSLSLTHVLRGESGGGTTIAFNPAGDRLATRGWNGKVHLFDVHTGGLLSETHALPPTSMPPLLRFDPTGRQLAAARVGPRQQQIGLWSVADAREYRVLIHGGAWTDEHLENGAGSLAIHHGGRLVVKAFKEGLALWDLETGREVKFVNSPGLSGCVCFDGAGNLLTNGSKGFFRWRVRATDPTRPCQLTVGPPEPLRFNLGNRMIAASKNGKVIAQAMYDGYGMNKYAGGWVLHPEAPEPRRFAAKESVNCASVHPAGRWVAFGRHVKGVNVYETATGDLEWQSQEDGHYYCRFSPDGRWLVSDSGGGLAYAVGTWQPGPPLGPGIPWDVSPDSYLVVVGQTDGVYRLVELATGRELARLKHPDATEGAALFTPDGTRLVTAAQHGLQVWDLRRIREELAELDLDWDQLPYPPSSELATVPAPLTVTVEMGDILKVR